MARIPEPESTFEAEGLPDPGETEDSQEITGDTPYGMEPPHDVAMAADDFGTTPYEEAHGESLDGRLAREQPDVLTDESVARTPEGDDLETPFHRPGSVGRLVEDDEGAREDRTAETVAHDVGTDVGGATAEEAAMHVVRDEG